MYKEIKKMDEITKWFGENYQSLLITIGIFLGLQKGKVKLTQAEKLKKKLDNAHEYSKIKEKELKKAYEKEAALEKELKGNGTNTNL